MSLLKATRKIKRAGKTAVQFRVTSTFEFIELECKGTWRPDTLRVVWMRNHRKVKSNDTNLVVTEDFGPNGARGKAIFSPALSVALVVTLYREANQTEFEEKEYKYQIVNDGPAGKKILATFNCNMAEFVAMPSLKQAMDFNFKCISKKVNLAKLGITLESQFMKEGGALDDDMQSTFSAMDPSLMNQMDGEEDDEEEEDEFPLPTAPNDQNRTRLNTLQEEPDSGESVNSVVLGTGERLKRHVIPDDAPPKPPRNFNEIDLNISEQGDTSDNSNIISSVEQDSVLNTNTEGKTGNIKESVMTEMSSNNGKNDPDLTFKQNVKLEPGRIQPIDKHPPDTVMVDSNVKAKPLETKEEIAKSEVAVNGNSNTTVQEEALQAEISKELATETISKRKEGSVKEIKSSPETVSTVENSCPSVMTNGGLESQKQGLKLEANEQKSVETEDIADPMIDKYVREINGSSECDYLFDTAMSLRSIVEVAEKNSLKAPITADPTPHNSGQARKTVDSNETYIPPPNPYLEDDKEEEQVVPKKPSSTETWIDPEAMFVDCFDAVVDREKLDQAELIGLYFSAGWCPPCRRFLPKLVKFYHHLKQHEKSFEIVYISSDYSKQDMMKYMKEQQMPWLGMVYEGDFADRFRKQFNVSAVPLFKIFGTKGELIEESAKKAVEGASNGSAILKLYNKWNEKLMTEEAKELGRTSVTKKGLLSKVRTSVQKQKSKEGEQSEELHSSENMSQKSSSPESGGRKTVDTRTRSKSKDKSVVSQELLDKKEERILHLEEVNKTLKQANEELSEEMDELRQKVQLLTTELEKIKSASKTLEDESKELIANLNMRGWLYKRGIRGPTASIWRRRYFRLDQGSKLYYYKSSSEGTPQGFIDLDKVINVQEVTASQQDKNHATFTIQCDGRNFQLQAHDETGMRKWMEAILYIRNWRKKHSTTISEDI